MTTFLAGLPGSEAIDRLNSAIIPAESRRADFLLFDRRVIVEMKFLVTDTAHKVDAEINKHRSRKDFPVFYGSADL